MDTFDLLPSMAQGELAESSGPEVAAAVYRSKGSGTMSVENANGEEIRVFFRAGEFCGTGPFSEFKTLAHVLLANDWVNVLDIEATQADAAASNIRHGEILVSRGLLTVEQLRDALAAQHRMNCAAFLALGRGRYEWRGWEPPPPWAREVAVDLVGCIIDALETDQWESRRRRVLEWLGGHAARLSLDWPDMAPRLVVPPLDRRAAALLALPRRFEEFVSASRLERKRAEALLVGLLLAGGAEPHPAAGASAPPPAAQPAPDVLDDAATADLLSDYTPAGDAEIVEPLPEPEPHVGDASFDEAAQFIEQAVDADLPAPDGGLPPPDDLDARLDAGLLGQAAPGARRSAPPVSRAAPAPDPLDEADAIARLDALDLGAPPVRGPATLRQSDGDVDLRDTGESLELDHGRSTPVSPNATRGALDQDDRAKALRKKMLAQGLRNMAPGRSAPEPEPAHEALPPPGLELSGGELDDEEQAFVDDVRSRVEQAPAQSAYVRLGITPGAPTEAVKTAYLQLVKRYHPDRVAGSPTLSFLQPELQALCASLKDAYDQVSTADGRAAYDQQLKGGTRTQSRREEAALQLKMGDVLLKKRDFEQALQKLRRATDLDANGDTLAALAWGLLSDPKATPATKEEAASLINRALRATGVTARTYYVAGVVWRTKDPDSAADAFRKALEIDPNHPDAALELRLLESRAGKAKKAGGGVLSGLLFGKRK